MCPPCSIRWILLKISPNVTAAMAIATGSQAVLLDAVYDGVEFFMLLPSVFLIPLLYRPSNEQHPFGYMQLETLFVVVKGITMAA